MEENIPYGFEIIQISSISDHFEIKDLAKDKTILKANLFGIFKPEFEIFDLDEIVVLDVKKTSVRKNSWSFIRNGKKKAELITTGGLCNTKYKLLIEATSYMVTIINSRTFILEGSEENKVVRVERIGSALSGKYKVEVEAGFEPLIALGLSLILIKIVQAKRAAKIGVAMS